ETPGHFWRAATCLLASTRSRLAHAVYFWSGVLDVSPVFERPTATQRDPRVVYLWSLKPRTAPAGCCRTLAQPLSPGRCRLAPGTISDAPGSRRLGLRYQHLGPHPGPSALRRFTRKILLGYSKCAQLLLGYGKSSLWRKVILWACTTRHWNL